MLNKIKLNGLLKKQQLVRFVGLGFAAILAFGLILLASKGSHQTAALEKEPDFTGVINSQFTEADGESAMTSQQLELDSLKKQMARLVEGMKTLQEQNVKQTTELTKQMVEEIARVKTETELTMAQKNSNAPVYAANEVFNPNATATDAKPYNGNSSAQLKKSNHINSVSFNYHRPTSRRFYKTIENYVPSATFARAVILGGVDADASVDAQNKNNGAMVFKILGRGTLPNGKRSHLNGCFVTASSYGDISSERAYGKLEKLSCVQDGKPIVDKPVTGWVYFGGKVGIKGVPLMRDGKIMTWAGVSGSLAGIAQAAQYAQSVQNFGAYGATSVVPSSNIGPFAAFGGASKAADQLSQYYIKRAEQYHPVIQIGSGNEVEIVFKDGFYLYDEPEYKEASVTHAQNNEPMVPPEVLAQINQAQLGQDLSTEGTHHE